MANVSRINGFTPVKHLTGAPYNGQFTTYAVPASDATALGVGDVVKFLASSSSVTSNGQTNSYKNVTRAAAGDAVVGTIVGFDIVPDSLNTPQYRTASTLRLVRVADATDLVFLVQTSNGTPAAANLGLNFNHANGTLSTSTGLSGATLDLNGGTGGAATATFKLLGWDPAPDNDNTSTGNKALVKINNHQLNSGTGTAGV